jgi:hypothetical protein
MYGRTLSPIDEIDRINAAHIFSDILSMAHDSHKPQVRPSKKKRGSNSDNSTSPRPSQVLPALFSRLTAVFRDQRPSWGDLFVLGKYPRWLHRINARYGTSAKDNESDNVPGEQIPAFHAGRISGIHKGIQKFISAINSIRRKVN